jgi:hypothetical protein
MCNNLSNINIPSSVVNFENGLFSSCTSLTSIDLSANNNTTFGSNIFSNSLADSLINNHIIN